MFNGQTGAAMATVNYVPARGTVSSWGDNYGNRVDRFLAGTAYLDGARPSLIMARGYYTRTVHRGLGLAERRAHPALDLRLQLLHQQRQGIRRPGQPQPVRRRRRRRRQGRDRLRGDGRRRQRQRRCGRPKTGHGDALHVGDLDPARAGLEDFKVAEATSQPAELYVDPANGTILWQLAASGDNGRGVAGGHLGRQRRRRGLVGVATPAIRDKPGRHQAAASRPPSTSCPGGTATRSANCSTAPTSTSTARPATPAC